MRPPLGRVLDVAQSATSGQRGRVRVRQLGSDVTPADVDGNVGGRVATDGDAAECSRLVLGVDEVAGDELAAKVRLVLVQQ